MKARGSKIWSYRAEYHTPEFIYSVRELYASGCSLRSVAASVGCSLRAVEMAVKDIVRHKEARAERTFRMNARQLMERHLGRKLDFNEVVHHVNEDPTDNRLENLEVMGRGEHSRLHMQKWDIPQYKRPNRFQAASCPICGLSFRQNKYGRKTKTCSRECGNKHLSQTLKSKKAAA